MGSDPNLMDEAIGSSNKDAEGSQFVIVGAGIAGLATALAFHRLGIKTLVLEQSDNLRPGGTSIGLWKNAWRALDALDVSDELRKNYFNISSFDIVSEAGKLINRVRIDNNASHELRPVERTALVEALAKPLPKETIRFNSKVTKISKAKEGSETEVYLEDGTSITSKMLIGCDGVHSVVAQWMGLKEPSFVGQYAIRGVAKYSAGHVSVSFSTQYLGRGVRAGIASISTDKVYWFVAFNNPKEQGWMTDPSGLKEQAKIMIKDWSSGSKRVIYDIIDNTPLETVSRSTFRDRLALPFLTPKLAVDGVTLAGDALHPITPNLAQGGCLALEDGVILAREIYTALKAQEEPSQSLSQALQRYVKQRWKRFLPLTIQSHIMGAVMSPSSPILSYLRDYFVLPLNRLSKHTQFDCGVLPTT